MNGQPISDPELIKRIYEAVVRKEALYDGVYYTCVHTTGIFCRPSCRSRTPLLKNISFRASVEDALQAGFRPCKRCKPESPGPAGPEVRLVCSAREAMDAAFPATLSLGELARRLHVSSYYLQRLFKRHTGASPAEYSASRRLEAARQLLDHTDLNITEISLRTGFSSAAYFSAFFQKLAGCSPTVYRQNSAAKRL